MNSNTKFFRKLSKLNVLIKKKIQVFQKSVIFSIFSLFLGFVFGNLFGTFLNFFRRFLNWDGLIILITILIVELINYLNYRPSHKNQNLDFVILTDSKNKKQINFVKILNFYKIGLLLGFFIDAFKVGS